jgi:hypothetical protein
MKILSAILHGVVFVATAIILQPVGTAYAQDKQALLPKFEVIEAAVWRYFQSQGNFQPNRIITKEQVGPLIVGLARMGFVVQDAKSLLEKIPANNEFLVVNLNTPAGREFMDQITKYPEAYDRLDRLIRLPHGKQTMLDLIKGPGGEKMIEYLTTAPGGNEMGKMLSPAPKGKDFNKPTGRIYTVPMLLRNLQEQYRAVSK